MNTKGTVNQRAGAGAAAHRPGVARLAQAAGLAVVLAGLPGCQNLAGTTSLSQVRIIDASPDAGGSAGLDVYQGSSILAYGVGFGTTTTYVPITPGGYTVQVDTGKTHQELVSASGTFLPNQQYTVLVGSYAASLQELILKDQNQAAPTGDISLRILDQSIRAGAVDVYLVPSGGSVTTTRPFVTGINFNSNTGYLDLPTGTYTLVVLPSGTAPTASGATLYTGAAVSYFGGTATTVVLIDTNVTTVPAINVLTATDYAPADE
jgi:hypothetical protein